MEGREDIQDGIKLQVLLKALSENCVCSWQRRMVELGRPPL